MAESLVPEPVWRRLRIFALDPALSAQFDTAGIGEVTISVPWEDLAPGPVGEYLEVVDVDPASDACYHPVDLNDPRILAVNGLTPSESNPQFHQQMAYAVAMATIGHFEQALGRVALWNSRRELVDDDEDDEGKEKGEAAKTGDQKRGKKHYRKEFVRRLRIYPHALRDRNAYYSPDKRALLFGYFPVGVKDAYNTPGTIVFSCLSHDIVAHETTHALLDGVHPRFDEPMNSDVLAFHEAFADIVALFQHFSYPGVLQDQIARTRGDLTAENKLAQLAQQFGQASGRGRALRDFLGRENKEKKEWERTAPDVRALDKEHEPHARGAILVAAVFGAFLKVYRSRTRDLFRIASEGTGVLRAGDIHPDLANRLAAEAAATARTTLQICIRAIDYCPPVGITFGDYLRAIVTGDYHANPEDALGYRLAFMESFRQWGIHPAGLRSMSVDSLMWPTGEEALEEVGLPIGFMKALSQTSKLSWLFWRNFRDAGSPQGQRGEFEPWTLTSDRLETWKGVERNSARLHKWLFGMEGRVMSKAFGLEVEYAKARPTVYRTLGIPPSVAVEVHSVRWAQRRGLRGEGATDLVVEITQRRRGYFDRDVQIAMDKKTDGQKLKKADFQYRAGCTLIIDPKGMTVRRVIRTPGTINDDAQLERMRRYLTGEQLVSTGVGLAPANSFTPSYAALHAREPFALLHSEGEA